MSIAKFYNLTCLVTHYSGTGSCIGQTEFGSCISAPDADLSAPSTEFLAALRQQEPAKCRGVNRSDGRHFGGGRKKKLCLGPYLGESSSAGQKRRVIIYFASAFLSLEAAVSDEAMLRMRYRTNTTASQNGRSSQFATTTSREDRIHHRPQLVAQFGSSRRDNASSIHCPWDIASKLLRRNSRRVSFLFLCRFLFEGKTPPQITIDIPQETTMKHAADSAYEAGPSYGRITPAFRKRQPGPSTR